MNEETVLFANPSAQSGKARDLIDEARTLLDRAGITHRFIPTMAEGTIRLIREAIDHGGARRVIYMGGDGTFAEVAKGVLSSTFPTEVAMGMLPTGTANDQGKSFGLEAGPAALADNVHVIARGDTTWLDVGRLSRLDESDQVTHSDLFFDSASIGFGAAILRQRNVDRESVAEVPVIRDLYRDQMVYVGAALKQILDSYISPTKFSMDAEIDGRLFRYESLMDVVIKNTRVFGGEWELAAGSSHDDGLFELVPIAGRRDFTSKLIATLRKAPFDEEDLRKMGIEHSRPVQGSSMSLTIFKPGAADAPAVQIDGEEFPAGDRFQVDVLERHLQLIVRGA